VLIVKKRNFLKIVMSALFCAMVFAGTWVAIPVGIGNVNAGDGVLLLCAHLLGGAWAAVAAAVGAALADLTMGYAVYAPATLVITALMALVAVGVYRLTGYTRLSPRICRLLSSVAAECVMVLGYFAYEALVLGLGLGAAASIPFNLVQGGVAVVLATLAYELIAKAKLRRD